MQVALVLLAGLPARGRAHSPLALPCGEPPLAGAAGRVGGRGEGSQEPPSTVRSRGGGRAPGHDRPPGGGFQPRHTGGVPLGALLQPV